MNRRIVKIGKEIAKKMGITKQAIAIQEKLDRLDKKKMKCPVDSVYHYCRSKGISVEEIYHAGNSEVLRPATWGTNIEEKVVEVNVPTIYWTKLCNAIVFGSNDIVLHDNICLHDKLDLPCATDYNLANGICTVLDQEKKKAEVYVSRRIERIHCGINMFGVASLNYYHWMMDILGRIEYINHFPELKDIPLLVDEDAILRKTYKEALDLFDNLHHPIIVLDRNKAYQIDVLYYFSPCTFGAVYRKNKNERKQHPLSYAKKEEVISNYREKANTLIANTKDLGFGKKLVIDRGNVTSRLLNESSMIELAEKHGFKRFNPGNYSLTEQIKIISQAKVIIGDEGAAFTNAIWGNDCVFAIIEPALWNDCLFSTIIHLSGNQSINLDAELAQSANNRDHILDLNYFSKFLNSSICKNVGE